MEDENQNLGPAHSPTFVPLVPPNVEETYSFYTALEKAMNEGKKISKLSWGDRKCYGLFKDSLLKLYRPTLANPTKPNPNTGEKTYTFYDWILSDGDVSGEDWIVL
jgi:hypothetical protein